MGFGPRVPTWPGEDKTLRKTSRWFFQRVVECLFIVSVGELLSVTLRRKKNSVTLLLTIPFFFYSFFSCYSASYRYNPYLPFFIFFSPHLFFYLTLPLFFFQPFPFHFYSTFPIIPHLTVTILKPSSLFLTLLLPIFLSINFLLFPQNFYPVAASGNFFRVFIKKLKLLLKI